MSVQFKNFIYLDDGEKDLVLSWRNDERVRSQMVTTDLISKENHYTFIEKLHNDNQNRYFLVTDDKPIAVTYLNNIQGKKAEIGIYLDPQLIGQGVGERVLEEFLDTLFFEAISLKVKKENQKAVKLYEKFGFKKSGEDEKFYYYNY